jgi:hypothetical protein
VPQRSRREIRSDFLEIASPCSVPWETMPGDERVRFCGQCRQNVFNIAGLTRLEAQRLIAKTDGRLCARVLRRPDGTIVMSDCWSRLRAARRKGILRLVAVLVLVVIPELIAMRFGLAGLRRLARATLESTPAAVANLPSPPTFPLDETVTVGQLAPPEEAEDALGTAVVPPERAEAARGQR